MMEKIVIGNRTFCVEGGAADVNIVLKETYERVEIYEIAVNFDSPRIPEKIKITTRDAGVDVYSTFDAAHKFRNISFGGAGKFVSRLASWAPFAQTLSKTGKNCALYALDDIMTPIAVSVKIDLDTLFVESETVLFDAVTNPVKSYCVQMRIDRRRIDFDDAVADLYAWYEQKGLRPLPAPRKAFVPMYSTWYSYLQNITAEDVVRECREAVKFGMKAVIIDDGWQTDDASVLYGYTGDWQPSRKKFPDMKGLTDLLHEMGMAVILWFSVPFVGYYSRNYERFKGKYLRNNDDINCSTLDPRFKEVRDFLVGTYVDAVKNWHLDGLKLDFIDRFYSNGVTSPGMDCTSVEEATRRLLEEITGALKSVKNDILIEFRQPYMGPVITSYGNMIRVWDCPLDPLSNRVGTLGLRLMCRHSAVHSDMISWTKEDSPENVAAALISALFAVPQISVRFKDVQSEQAAALDNYLKCRAKYADVIDGGKLKLFGPESNYSAAVAVKDGCMAAATFGTSAVDVGRAKNAVVFNVTSIAGTVIKNAGPFYYKVFDCCGSEVESGASPGGLTELKIPFAGRAELAAD